MSAVRPATEADLPAAGRALARAFADDPVWTWLTPNEVRYQRAAPRFFEVEAAVGRRGPGQVLVDPEGRGAAVWAAPEHWKSTVAHSARLAIPALLLFGRRTRQSLASLTALEKAHPTTPHWYLALLGTDPQHQGHGIGSALIRGVTDRCDAEGVPAYLESSKEANVSFYARHGFEVTQVLDLPQGGPPMWLMWREPR